MGGYLGYDTGVISAVLVNLHADLGHVLSSSEQELITSLTSGGALIGAVVAGMTVDEFGRKYGAYIGCVLFLLGSIIQASAFSIAQMSVGRFVVGLGIGSAAMIIPLYVGGLAPARHRGRIIALGNMSVTFGKLITYALGAALTGPAHGWRWMVVIGVVPPIVLFFMLLLYPESPRSLIAHGKRDEAPRVIARVFPHATEAQVTARVDHIEHEIQVENNVLAGKSLACQFKQLHCVPSNLRALIPTCAIMTTWWFQYSHVLLSNTLRACWFENATVVSIVVGATNFIFGIVILVIVCRVGRRRIILTTVLEMSLTLVLCAIAFHFTPVYKDLVLEATSVNWVGIVVLVAIILYIAFFSGGVNVATIAWIGTELLPLEVRALGTMTNTVTCCGCNIIIDSIFLSMMKGITPIGAWVFIRASGSLVGYSLCSATPTMRDCRLSMFARPASMDMWFITSR
ncbi:putative Major facilitator superfamily (MFS) profile domain-containing protein [Seiridium unicorne]|uniref:Major facilitator superfamily (MFS) profile domain-containing protein n=1 Tax=Seiridium unicorne TaxID=138068 RepID=A0ABR2UGQ3_9PEZI